MRAHHNADEWKELFSTIEGSEIVPDDILRDLPHSIDSDELHQTSTCDIHRLVYENKLCTDPHCRRLHPDFIDSRWSPLNFICRRHFQGECTRSASHCWNVHGHDLASAIRRALQHQQELREDQSLMNWNAFTNDLKPVNRGMARDMIVQSYSWQRRSFSTKFKFGKKFLPFESYWGFERHCIDEPQR